MNGAIILLLFIGGASVLLGATDPDWFMENAINTMYARLTRGRARLRVFYIAFGSFMALYSLACLLGLL